MKVDTIGTVNNSGSMGGITAVNVKGHIYYRAKRSKLPKHAKMTFGQRRGQAQLATVTSAYHPMADLLQMSLLRTGPMERVYNLFTKYNMGSQRALLTKEEVDGGWQLLDNYVVSRGTGAVPSIAMTTVDGFHVSNLNISHLQWDGETRLCDFATAIIGANEEFGEGESLTFVVCEQRFFDSPRKATIRMRKATLPLVVKPLGIGKTPVAQLLDGIEVAALERSEGRLLAMPARECQMAAIVHGRRMRDQQMDCSEQRLVGSNPWRDELLNEERAVETILSYGPVKKETLPHPEGQEKQPKRF